MTAVDLLLVHALGRMHNQYLCLVRHLGRRLRIGVLAGPLARRVRTEATETEYFRLYRELGAEVITGGPVRTRLLLVPQFPFADGWVESLPHGGLAADRTVALQTFGYGNVYLEPFVRAGIERLWVWDRDVLDGKLKTEADRRWVAGHFAVTETGSPFRTYPVFDDFETDYLIGFPTELSFPTTGGRARFLVNVARLLGVIGRAPRVVLKPHNVVDGGRAMESGSRMFALGARLDGSRAGRGLAAAGAWTLGGLGLVVGRAAAAGARLEGGAAYGRIARRATPLGALTPCANFGIELFLPGVRKGLITGRSSSVWHALANDLAVYNCDDETGLARSETVLDAYRTYGVPPCGGRLAFDRAAFGRVSSGARAADLVKLVEAEL